MPILRNAAPFAAAFAIAPACLAAERGFMVTDFERLEVSGDMSVTVEKGRAISIRASGHQRALDRLIVEVRGKVLRVRPMAGGWGGWPGERVPAPTVKIIVPELSGAYAEGASHLHVARLEGSEVRVGQSGSANVTIGLVEADRLLVNQQGAGSLILSGTTRNARVSVYGSGKLDGSRLESLALDLATSSSGEVVFAGGRTALVRASGSGSVTVTGKPACTVRALGSGVVQCGQNRSSLFGGNQ